MAHAPAPAAAGKQNPEWWRTLFASFMLALFLRIGLHVPFLTSFTALGVIYLTQIVFTEMRTGARMVGSGVKIAINVAIGMIIFLALRYLIAGVIGIYPIDTFDAVKGAHGLKEILGGRGTPKSVLWEMCFAFVAGGLAAAWTQGKGRKAVGTIFALSLIILSVQIGLPKYTATFPSRAQVDSTLAEKGLRGALKGAIDSSSPTSTGGSRLLQQYEQVVVDRMASKTTPVCDSINHPFKLDTEGDPATFNYHLISGKDTVIKYSGHGDIDIPPHTRAPGLSCVAPIDPRKTIRVRIKEIVYRP